MNFVLQLRGAKEWAACLIWLSKEAETGNNTKAKNCAQHNLALIYSYFIKQKSLGPFEVSLARERTISREILEISKKIKSVQESSTETTDDHNACKELVDFFNSLNQGEFDKCNKIVVALYLKASDNYSQEVRDRLREIINEIPFFSRLAPPAEYVKLARDWLKSNQNRDNGARSYFSFFALANRNANDARGNEDGFGDFELSAKKNQ